MLAWRHPSADVWIARTAIGDYEIAQVDDLLFEVFGPNHALGYYRRLSTAADVAEQHFLRHARPNPLTAKGRKILAAMQRTYGKKRGTQVFYASANKGTITDVHRNPIDTKTGIALLGGLVAGGAILYYLTRKPATTTPPVGGSPQDPGTPI